MYANLEAELSKKGLTMHELSKLLGIEEIALRDKLDGKTEFKFSEAAKIKRLLNTDISIETLFDA